jgi:CRISPR system Cascade subunit CasA
MATEAGFNLLDEPWIVALRPDGQERELSILDVFEQAPWLATLAGEVPTQGFAITRLLLAFLHRTNDGPQDQDEWVELWNAPELPMDRIRDYADRVRHRFDLFDAEAPFFQVPDLRTEKGEMLGLEKVVADVPTGRPYFTTRSAASLEAISPAEAARWLVHTHAFDPSGIKSGAVGDPTVKGGRGYPIGTGWLGQVGGILPEGANLRETLLLNLISRDVGTYVRIGGPDDLPPWERPVDDAAWEDNRPVRGAIDLYTWQTRRVRLAGDRHGVTGVLLANGDKISPQNRHGVEPHSAWRYSEPQTKKHGHDVYMPRMHDANRSVWRGLEALLPSVSSRRTPAKDAQRFLPPGVLQWLAELVQVGHLDRRYVVKTRIVGAQYGVQSATYDEIIHDRLPLAVALLSEDDPALGRAAVNAVGDAEQVAGAVWRFAENLAQAAGAEAKSGAGDHAREQLYAGLDQPYRRWLAGLGVGTDPMGARAEWQVTVRAVCRPVAAELLQVAGPAAWTGRTVGNRLVNVALAEVWFNAALRKALPHAFSETRESTQEVA